MNGSIVTELPNSPSSENSGISLYFNLGLVLLLLERCFKNLKSISCNRAEGLQIRTTQSNDEETPN